MGNVRGELFLLDKKGLVAIYNMLTEIHNCGYNLVNIGYRIDIENNTALFVGQCVLADLDVYLYSRN